MNQLIIAWVFRVERQHTQEVDIESINLLHIFQEAVQHNLADTKVIHLTL